MYPPHIEQLKGLERLAAIASRPTIYRSTVAARNVLIKRTMRATAINDPRQLIGLFPKEWVDDFAQSCNNQCNEQRKQELSK